MSSLPKIDSLSGLIAYAASVEKLLYGGDAIDQEGFDRLRQELNWLQSNCPTHKGVLRARVRWYELLLDNCELHVVVPLESGKSIDIGKLYWGTHDNPSIFGGPQAIEHFMRRSYLKGDFPRLYQRFLSLYDRLAKCEAVGEHRNYFADRAQRFRDELLEGRL